MEHIKRECNCVNFYCSICSGGLFQCQVCRLAEGELTTECPGVPVSHRYAGLIYHGILDFKNGVWVRRLGWSII